MVQINFAQKSVTVKIVYYGPGMSGKTTNLEIVHQRAPDTSRGELTSISTDGDRTLFFDFMPLDLGTVAGMRTQFQIYTVPGQVYYNSTRKLVLQGVDGVIFIADSSASMMEENLESLRNLEENLAEYGKSIDTIPLVIQYNKRDLPDALPVEQLQQALNARGCPHFEAMANTGQGVFPTLKALAALVLDTIHEQTGSSSHSAPAAAPAPVPAAAFEAPAPPLPFPQHVAPSPALAPEPPMAVPAAASVKQGATGFYPAPGAAPSPPVPPAPPMHQPPHAGSTGYYQTPMQQPVHPPSLPPHPGMQAGQAQAPAAPPMHGIPVAVPQHPSGPGVQGFPQPGHAPQQFGGPDALSKTGIHPPPHIPQHPGQGHDHAHHLRMASHAGAGMSADMAPQSMAPTSAPPPGRSASPQPAVPPAAAPVSPRIKPRTSALPTPAASDKKSAMITAIFVVVALAVGIGIGGFAFGLF